MRSIFCSWILDQFSVNCILRRAAEVDPIPDRACKVMTLSEVVWVKVSNIKDDRWTKMDPEASSGKAWKQELPSHGQALHGTGAHLPTRMCGVDVMWQTQLQHGCLLVFWRLFWKALKNKLRHDEQGNTLVTRFWELEPTALRSSWHPGDESPSSDLNQGSLEYFGLWAF